MIYKRFVAEEDKDENHVDEKNGVEEKEVTVRNLVVEVSKDKNDTEKEKGEIRTDKIVLKQKMVTQNNREIVSEDVF